jgi:anti-anti-sigma regulatory factor
MKAVLDDTNLTLIFEESLLSTDVQRLRMQYLQILEQAGPVTSITADIAQVAMIDSLGLNFIIGLYNDSREKRCVFRLSGASPSNMKLFELVNLQEHVTLG